MLEVGPKSFLFFFFVFHPFCVVALVVDHLAKFGNNKNMKVGQEFFGGEFWFVG
jgi:hypothetical protein